MSTLGDHWSRTRAGRFDLALCVLAVLLGYLLKRHYSVADAQDLYWILKPTAMLVGLLTGNEFAYEAAGFVNTRLRLVITPACAGVNFLVMALLTLVFGSAGYGFGPGRKLLLCAGFVLTALGATVIVNAARIVLVAYVFSEHRLLGVVLYASSLSLLHLGSRALLGQALSQRKPANRVACAC